MQTLYRVLIMPEYVWSTFHRVLNKPPGSKYARTQNMARLGICEGYAQATEYA